MEPHKHFYRRVERNRRPNKRKPHRYRCDECGYKIYIKHRNLRAVVRGVNRFSTKLIVHEMFDLEFLTKKEVNRPMHCVNCGEKIQTHHVPGYTTTYIHEDTGFYECNLPPRLASPRLDFS